MLRAYDKATGKEVGAVYMPAPQSGSPMTYMLNGKQYIVVAISGQGFPGELIAYRLPSGKRNRRRRVSRARTKPIFRLTLLAFAAAAFPLAAQEPHPTCNHCEATYIPKSESTPTPSGPLKITLSISRFAPSISAKCRLESAW